MTYDEIISSITHELTGDPKKDIPYLKEQCDKYKDTEYGKEIVRACGRLLANYLSDKDKETVVRELKNFDLGIDSTLEEVKFNQFQKNFNKALELIEPLIKKIEEMCENGMYVDDKVSEYHCFNNLVEEVMYTYYNKVEKEQRASDIPYASVYFQYGSLLIDLDRWEDAQKALEKAKRWNPSSANIILELCETYKHLKQFDLFFETVKDTFKYCYEPHTLARCYRALGWYFTEKELYEDAIAVYVLSLQFEPSDFVTSEMYYISQKSGKQFEHPDFEETKKVAEKYGIPIGAHEDVLGITYSLGKDAMEKDAKEAAKYFFNFFYQLTGNETVKELIDKLDN